MKFNQTWLTHIAINAHCVTVKQLECKDHMSHVRQGQRWIWRPGGGIILSSSLLDLVASVFQCFRFA